MRFLSSAHAMKPCSFLSSGERGAKTISAAQRKQMGECTANSFGTACLRASSLQHPNFHDCGHEKRGCAAWSQNHFYGKKASLLRSTQVANIRFFENILVVILQFGVSTHSNHVFG